MKRNPSAVLASLSSGRSSHDIDVLGSVQVDQVRYSVVAVLHEARRQDLMCVVFTFTSYFAFHFRSVFWIRSASRERTAPWRSMHRPLC